MKLQELSYKKPPYQLKNLGVMMESDGQDMLANLFDPYGMEHFLRKWVDSDDEYDYYSVARVGYMGFIPFYRKERTLRDWFIMCKSYHIERIPMLGGDSEVTSPMVMDKREFADIYGPLDGTFYKEQLYSEYAKQMAKEFIK